MTGRAGRRGMDRIGFVLTVPGKFMDIRQIARLITASPSDVHSRIRVNFPMTLNLLLSHTPKRPPGAFDPENPLIFSIGPLAGLKVHGSSRYGVYTRSPQTEIYSESYSGGKVALSMAQCGVDAFLLKGACPSPVFLEVTDQRVIFHEAGDLWGLETYEAEEKVSEARDHYSHISNSFSYRVTKPLRTVRGYMKKGTE